MNNNILNLVADALNNAFAKIKDTSLELAKINPNDTDAKTQIANSSFSIISDTNILVNDLLKASGVDSKISEPILNITDKLLGLGKEITNLISIDTTTSSAKVDIANSSVDLVSNVNELINSILKSTSVDEKISQALKDSTDLALKNIKVVSQELAKIDPNDASSKAKIATNSFEIISQANELINSTLKAANLDSHILNSVSILTNNVLGLGKSITGIVSADLNSPDDKVAIAENSVTLVGDVNNLISGILSAAKIDNEISKSIAEVTNEALTKIKGTAVQIASVDTDDKNSDANIATHSLTLISQANALVKDILKATKVDTHLSNSLSGVTDELLNLGKGVTKLVTDDPSTTDGKVNIAANSVELVGDVNNLIKSILITAKLDNETSNSVANVINSALDEIKDTASSIAGFDPNDQDGKAGIAKGSLELINQINKLVNDAIKSAGTDSHLINSLSLVSSNLLNLGKSVTDLVNLNPTTQDGKVAIAVNSVDLLGNVNGLINSILNAAKIDESISKSVLDVADNTLSKIKQTAIQLAKIDPSDSAAKSLIATNSLDLIAQANTFIKDVLHVTNSNSHISDSLSDVTSNLLGLGKSITGIVSADANETSGKVAIAENSVTLVGDVNSLIQGILSAAKLDSDTTKAISDVVSSALGNIKDTAKQIAALNPNEKAEIAKSSFTLIAQTNTLIKDALNAAKVNSHISDSLSDITNKLLDIGKSVAGLVNVDLTSKDGKAQIAAGSVNLAGDVNNLINAILLAANIDASVSKSVQDITNKALVNIKDTAVSLAKIDINEDNGKAQIASGSLELISQSNGLINDILNATNSGNHITNSISGITGNLLDLGKSITGLVSANANTPNGKADIAAGSVDIIGNLNGLIKNILSSAKIDNVAANAIISAVDKSLNKIKSTATELAKLDASNKQGQVDIAKQSLTLINQTNELIKDALDQAKASTHLTDSISLITTGLLDVGRNVASLSISDSSTPEGRAIIAKNSVDLVNSANTLLKSILTTAKVSDSVVSSIDVVSKHFVNIAKTSIDLTQYQAGTKQGDVGIAKGSLDLISEANGVLKDVLTAANLNTTKTDAAAGITNSVLNIGKSIADLIYVDPNSEQGKISIATNSLNIIGSTNALVKDILSLTKAGQPLTEAITGSISGTLGSISSLVQSAIKLQNFNSLSKAEQVAVGFDVGLKSFSTVATGVSTIAQAVEKITGVTSSLPAIGAVASSAALAISPVEIKGLVDQKQAVDKLATEAIETKKLGYSGDTLLASLLNEKFALDTAYVSTDIALTVATTAISAAAAASVVAAPVAVIAGVVKGVISGILAAVKQPSLEVIANRYKDEILDSGNVREYFEHDTKASLNKIYANENFKEYLKLLQYGNDVDAIVSLDGVATSQNAIHLSAITGLSDQLNKANNYATLVRNGDVLDDDSQKAFVSLDQSTGVLNIRSTDKTLINFNTPLFAPGVEESARKQVGKNSYYTNLIINGPANYTINDSDASNTFVSNDKYASSLFGADGKLVKNITLKVNANGGDDTLIADANTTEFNGGSGTDSVNYNNDKIHGINVSKSANGDYVVLKNIKDADVVVEKIATNNVQYGKRTDKVDYRELSIETKSYESSDLLKNTEIISGSDYDDVMNGGANKDHFLGQNGNDYLDGKDGDDILFGGKGDDKILGGSGNDIINGEAGSDKIYAEDGDDLVIQDDIASKDILDGGKGNDTIDLSGMSVGDKKVVIFNEDFSSFNSANTEYELVKDTTQNAQASIQTKTKWGVASEYGRGGNGDKFLFVDGASDANKAVFTKDVELNSANEYELSFFLTQNSGARLGLYVDDKLVGEFNMNADHKWQEHSLKFSVANSGFKTIAIKDLATQGLGNDFAIDDINLFTTIKAGLGVNANLTDGTLLKASGITDEITKFENIIGTNADDILTGDAQDNLLVANAGNDTLYGLGGNDILIGGTGNNELIGGDGDDFYSVLSGANNTIKDSQGSNTLSINSGGKSINLKLDFKDNILDIQSYVNSVKIGDTFIHEFDKFGKIKLDNSYFLDITKDKSGNKVEFDFKYVINGASVDFQANPLNFTADADFNIYIANKLNDVKLSAVNSNVIHIYDKASAIIKGFNVGKDKLSLDQFLLSNAELGKSELNISNYDKNGSDVSISLNNETQIVLAGVGSDTYANKSVTELAQIYGIGA